MTKTLRILLAEDSPDDAELNLRALKNNNIDLQWQRVDNEVDYLKALDELPDLVLCDFSMPSFNALRALELLQQKNLDIPFIVVSGTIGEETAVAMMQAGANDYLLKNNLARLGPAVQRALRDYETRLDRQRAEQALREHEKLTQLILENALDAVIAMDLHGRITEWNKQAERTFGWTASEALGRSLAKTIIPQPYREAHELGLKRFLATGKGVLINKRIEIMALHREGHEFPVELTVSAIQQRSGYFFSAFLRDITERKRSEERLRLAAKAFESTAEGIIIVSADRQIVSVNQAFTTITGYTADEVRGKDAGIFQSGRHDVGFYTRIWETLRDTGHWQGEVWNRRKNGEIYPTFFSISAVRGDNGHTSHYVSVFTDISQHKQYEERLEFLAHHDALTGLPNRTLFQERLRAALIRARRHGHMVGLALIDLDRFKTINDSLGHTIGDALLQSVAERLSSIMWERDTVARLGGDEFAVLLDELGKTQDAAVVANKLTRALNEPFSLPSHELFTSASIGVCCYPEDGDNVQALLKNADTAMYRAKAQGRNTYQFFSAEMNTQAVETLELANSLRQALERDEFLLDYQPCINIASGKITGVEALIRWQHPQRGLIPPDRFIPLAEETGIIGPIGEWVLKTACRQAKAWQQAAYAPIRMAVNLSARQFGQIDLVERIAGILQESGLDAHWLELEITESMVMEDPERTERILAELNAMDVTIAIDDFGTGYSSLNYLKHFSIDFLKIDRSFVNGVPLDGDDMAITKTIIAMAKSLKLQVIAEGVEKNEQLAFLKAEGCEEAQGYLFSRPCTAKLLEKFLKKNAEIEPLQG